MAARKPNPKKRGDSVAVKARLEARKNAERNEIRRAKRAEAKRVAAEVVARKAELAQKRQLDRIDRRNKPTKASPELVPRPVPETKIHNHIPAAILFSTEVLKQVENMAAIGLPDSDIAAVCGISNDRFYKDKKLVPEINEALVRGRAKGHAMAAGVVFNAANSGSFQAATYILERKHGDTWRPKPVEIHNTNVTATASLEQVEKIKSLVPKRAENGGALPDPA